VIIAAVAGTILFLPPWATVVLAAIVAAAGGAELARLARPIGMSASAAFVALSAAAFCIVLSVPLPAQAVHRDVIVALAIGLTIGAGLVTLATTAPGPAAFGSMAIMLLAPLYVGLPLGTLAWVRVERGAEPLVWLLSVLAISDSAQYFAGTWWGRRPLAPVISPKKTVEGALAGLVAAPLAGAAIGRWALPEQAMVSTAGLALGLALFGMAGDLFESLLKRSAGAKDSSALIPGHGGVLDRIDALLFAAPIFYLFLRYVA
jgi:phosphatidate cytidylyltransferase